MTCLRQADYFRAIKSTMSAKNIFFLLAVASVFGHIGIQSLKSESADSAKLLYHALGCSVAFMREQSVERTNHQPTTKENPNETPQCNWYRYCYCRDPIICRLLVSTKPDYPTREAAFGHCLGEIDKAMKEVEAERLIRKSLGYLMKTARITTTTLNGLSCILINGPRFK